MTGAVYTAIETVKNVAVRVYHRTAKGEAWTHELYGECDVPRCVERTATMKREKKREQP